ncbi:hypothetical protein ACFL1D_04935 [Candidatus Omnitrophota bacterium]
MILTRVEKILYAGLPWFFGTVMLVSGILVNNVDPVSINGVILACAGLLCMSLYCICVLLLKLIEK